MGTIKGECPVTGKEIAAWKKYNLTIATLALMYIAPSPWWRRSGGVGVFDRF